MMAALLGLPLERALEELAAQGVASVNVERLLAPRSTGESGEWRVVRAREGQPPTLDVCCFERGVKR